MSTYNRKKKISDEPSSVKFNKYMKGIEENKDSFSRPYVQLNPQDAVKMQLHQMQLEKDISQAQQQMQAPFYNPGMVGPPPGFISAPMYAPYKRKR